MADEKTFTKTELDAAIEAAVGKVQESIDRLEAKNKELIGENRKLKTAGEIKPEDLRDAEERADKAEARARELESESKKLIGERDKAVKALETEQGFTQKLLIQDGLKTALIANGVKDEDYITSLSAQFGLGATVKVEGDKRLAMIGDKSLEDSIKEWAGTDAGKKYISAPVNSGGGAPGGDKGSVAAKTMTRAAYNALDQNQKAELGSAMAKGELTLTDG